MPAARHFAASDVRFECATRVHDWTRTGRRANMCRAGAEFFWPSCHVLSLIVRIKTLQRLALRSPAGFTRHRGTAALPTRPRRIQRRPLAARSLSLSRRPDLLAQTARNPSSRSALEPAARSAELRLEPSSGRVLAIPWRWTNTHTTRTDASRDHPMFTEGLATAMGVCGPR